ncbi:hypothetical protein JB92DRAFT_3096439 [Gautieria morchelliformis]|nr:hypothetical protein JB92DRAFT_3096439 [Gautieria morchelliformis]
MSLCTSAQAQNASEENRGFHFHLYKPSTLAYDLVLLVRFLLGHQGRLTQGIGITGYKSLVPRGLVISVLRAWAGLKSPGLGSAWRGSGSLNSKPGPGRRAGPGSGQARAQAWACGCGQSSLPSGVNATLCTLSLSPMRLWNELSRLHVPQAHDGDVWGSRSDSKQVCMRKALPRWQIHRATCGYKHAKFRKKESSPFVPGTSTSQEHPRKQQRIHRAATSHGEADHGVDHCVAVSKVQRNCVWFWQSRPGHRRYQTQLASGLWLHSSLVPRVTPLGEGKIWHDILMSYPWVSSVTGASDAYAHTHPHPHAGLSPPMLHHSGSPILLPPLCFTPHPENHREFHNTCPPPAAPACSEPACVAARDCGVLSPPLSHRHSPAADRPARREHTHPAPVRAAAPPQPRPNPAPPAGSGVMRLTFLDFSIDGPHWRPKPGLLKTKPSPPLGLLEAWARPRAFKGQARAKPGLEPEPAEHYL